jgi:NTE family protein
MERDARGAAIVVAGAVAKGAFAAGALAYVTERLHEEGTPIRSLVGTSSGALNATKMAHGVRAGDPVKAANELVTLWVEEARAGRVAQIDLLSAIVGHGVSGSEKVIEILEQTCPLPGSAEVLQPVALRIVVTRLDGDEQPHTSFEHVERFQDAEFEDTDKRRRMFSAAAASAAVPYAFKALRVADMGPCVDGGLVNNAPIKEAIAHDPSIDRIIVIVADPPRMRLSAQEANALANVPLGLRLLEIVVNERLVRDLEEAKDVNRWLASLDRLVKEGEMTPCARGEVIRSLYDRDPTQFRHLDLIEIRPRCELPGNPFSGFFRGSAFRSGYVKLGREAAKKAWLEHKELAARMRSTG